MNVLARYRSLGGVRQRGGGSGRIDLWSELSLEFGLESRVVLDKVNGPGWSPDLQEAMLKVLRQHKVPLDQEFLDTESLLPRESTTSHFQEILKERWRERGEGGERERNWENRGHVMYGLNITLSSMVMITSALPVRGLPVSRVVIPFWPRRIMDLDRMKGGGGMSNPRKGYRLAGERERERENMGRRQERKGGGGGRRRRRRRR